MSADKRRPDVRHEGDIDSVVRGRQEADKVAAAVEDWASAGTTWNSAVNGDAGAGKPEIASVEVAINNTPKTTLRTHLDVGPSRDLLGAIANS